MQINENYLYGRNAIIEALNSGTEIEKVFIIYGTKGNNLKVIYTLCKKGKIPIATIDRRKFASLEENAEIPYAKSQGVIALVKTVTTYHVDELIQLAFHKSKTPIIAVLDEIEDPQNLGAIARTVECVGGAGMIITSRNSAPITPTAVKASAGAIELIPVAKVDSLIQAMEKLKNAGFWIVGTDMDGSKLYFETFYDSPIAVVIGSEGKGLRQSTKKHCDILVKIPLHGKISSLNASVSAAIVLYEASRQRSVEFTDK